MLVYPVLLFIILLALMIITLGPQLWVRYTIRKYDQIVDSLPGSGGEFAHHLISRFNLMDIRVEETGKHMDHYDPEKKAIRLSQDNLNNKSLTAVTIAVHEFSHALQHQSNFQPFRLRYRLAKIVHVTEKIASIILLTLPITVLLAKFTPLLLVWIVLMGMSVLLHLITLPVELDASFRRALPILQKGQYLPEAALPIARKILTAAALTYLASALANILNFYRWFAILRR